MLFHGRNVDFQPFVNITKGNDPFLFGQRVKAFLRAGARRPGDTPVPDRRWGYGALCLRDSMDILREYMKGGSELNMFRNLVDSDSGGANESLAEYVKKPGVVSFNIVYSGAFRRYIADKPYIKLGTVMPGEIAVAYAPWDILPKIADDMGDFDIYLYPRLYGLMDTYNLEEAGILAVQRQTNMNLRGSGTLLGFVDTGIDYADEAFIYEDGTSKIRYIWDQSVEGKKDADVYYGSVHTREDLNKALASLNPRETVSHRDEEGHGTFLASLAGGREGGDFKSAAPDAEIIAVKLKKADQRYIDSSMTLASQDNVFEATDIMLGLKFILDKAAELERPVAVCLGIGSNFLAWNAFSPLEECLSVMALQPGVIFCAAAGNEGGAKHHTMGKLAAAGATADIDVSVAEKSGSFNISLWTSALDIVTVSLQSPTGEVVGKVPMSLGNRFDKKLPLEKSTVSVTYYKKKFNQLTYIRIADATPGIWKITIYGETVIDGDYHAYLPISGFVSPGVEFMSPDPNWTIVSPATALGVMAVGAYNSADNSLYVSSSWGPASLERVSPDFTAPGVSVGGEFPLGHGAMSGTSVSAAIAAGACALLLQWGIVEKRYPGMDTGIARTIIVRGCTRSPGVKYPNDQWGYGRLNLIGTFQNIKEI